MLLTAMLAATVWTLPASPPALKPAADRLPAPQVSLRWKVRSGSAAAKPEPTQAKVSPVCQQIGVQKADMVAKDVQPGARQLSKEPPAKEIKALLYTEGGCSKPIVVRGLVGARPAGE